MSGFGFSPLLPLSLSPADGFALNRTLPQMVKQNLKSLFLTNPGERIMDPEFGVGLKKFLFEPNISYTHELLKSKISQQIKKYMPFITIVATNIVQDFDNPNVFYLKFNYIISPLNQSDEIDLRLSS